MTKEDVAKTSKIANVQIYVKQAIKRMNDFKILSNELQIVMLPLADDIITVCGALTNLLPPLCSD